MKEQYGLLHRLLASVFFVGYMPFAPGTFGTLAAAAFVWFFKPSPASMTIITAACFVIGGVSSHYAEKAFREKDSGKIVIDEFTGYLVSVAFLPLNETNLIAAFVLFRFFDILKPSPIRDLEKATAGGVSVMLDDVLAGVFTNAILQAWNRI